MVPRGTNVRAYLGALTVTATLGLCLDIALARNPGSGLIHDQPVRVTETCFWTVPLRPDTRNILAQDTAESYYYTSFHLPPGARVVLRGEFPRSRFMSLTLYGTVDGQAGVPTAALTDFEIDPDQRSVNPFRSGARRKTRRRSYTVTLRGEPDPGAGNRALNTLYAGQAGQTDTTQFVEIIYRIDRPDRGADLAGNVRPPKPMLVRADNSTSRGEALCRELQVVAGSTAPIPPFGPPLGLPAAQYHMFLALGPPTHPAMDPVVWDAPPNPARFAEPFLRGTILAPLIATLPTAPASVPYAAPVNWAVIGYASRLFGPDPSGHNLLVLHGKMPTHPTTFGRDPLNNSAGKEVRYWSLCNYGALVNEVGIAPVAMDGCLFDEQVPSDASGHYTIVVSLPEDRPANATDACGVAWLDWGTKGDWLDRPDLIALAIRNQLPAPAFAQGIDKVLTPGTERLVMGPYLPTGTYLSRVQFEARGCPAESSPSPSLRRRRSPSSVPR